MIMCTSTSTRCRRAGHRGPKRTPTAAVIVRLSWDDAADAVRCSVAVCRLWRRRPRRRHRAPAHRPSDPPPLRRPRGRPVLRASATRRPHLRSSSPPLSQLHHATVARSAVVVSHRRQQQQQQLQQLQQRRCILRRQILPRPVVAAAAEIKVRSALELQ